MADLRTRLVQALDLLGDSGIEVVGLRMTSARLLSLWDGYTRVPQLDRVTGYAFCGIPVELLPTPPAHRPDYYTDNP